MRNSSLSLNQRKNPELARPEFETINWEVDTYRGSIPISQEALDDSVANLTAIVSENINEQKINTLNEKIGAVLKAFNPSSISNVDDLKEIINVKLDPGYDRQIICTQSFYQKLDTLKMVTVVIYYKTALSTLLVTLCQV